MLDFFNPDAVLDREFVNNDIEPNNCFDSHLWLILLQLKPLPDSEMKTARELRFAGCFHLANLTYFAISFSLDTPLLAPLLEPFDMEPFILAFSFISIFILAMPSFTRLP